MRKLTTTSAVLLALCTLAVGCVTPRHKGFVKIHDGMDKASVLEVAGNPNKTQRWNGKDRWTYSYPLSDTNTEVKEVHFENGRVVYVGEKIAPLISAEEQDRRNDVQNKIDEQATFAVPGSTYIELKNPNWENLTPNGVEDSSPSQSQ